VEALVSPVVLEGWLLLVCDVVLPLPPPEVLGSELVVVGVEPELELEPEPEPPAGGVELEPEPVVPVEPEPPEPGLDAFAQLSPVSVGVQLPCGIASIRSSSVMFRRPVNWNVWAPALSGIFITALVSPAS
jgi:hypothetical protein